MTVFAAQTGRRLAAATLFRSIAIHPEAVDWRARVIANGGSVSNTTLGAVSKFCRAIDAVTGLRAAIVRCNLFCGSDLTACLTPLYLSSAPLATVGGTTDTNNNFVSGDYAETGSSGGLKGNGSNKSLSTGLNALLFVLPGSSHISYSGMSLETSGDRIACGSYSGVAATGIFCADVYAAYVSGRPGRIGATGSGNFPVVTSPATSESHYIITRTSTTAISLYQGGTLFGTNTNSQTPLHRNGNIPVFCLDNAGTLSNYTAGRLRMYSIGYGLTATQASAFSSAVAAFNTELSRA